MKELSKEERALIAQGLRIQQYELRGMSDKQLIELFEKKLGEKIIWKNDSTKEDGVTVDSPDKIAGLIKRIKDIIKGDDMGR